MNPLLMRAGLYLAVLAGLFLFGYRTGYNKAEDLATTAKAVALEDAAEKYQAEVEKVANLGARLTEQIAARNTEFQTMKKEVTHVIEKPVYRDCKLDDDGFRLWSSANHPTDESAHSTEPDAGMPATPGP